MTAPRIFFLHNPKAGGSSLRSVFAALNNTGSIAPVFGNAPADYQSNREFVNNYRGYDLYAGHYGYDVYRAIGDGHLLVTNFRDPIQRIYSMYRYWRNDVKIESLDYNNSRDIDVVMLAHKLDFSKFIRSNNEDLFLYISDFHFRQIYHSGWKKIRNNRISNLIVHRRLRRMPWFYIAETPQVSEFLLRTTFPQAARLEIPNENKTSGDTAPISQDDAKYLIRLNLRDYAIYAHALRIQAERLRKSLTRTNHALPPYDMRQI